MPEVGSLTHRLGAAAGQSDAVRKRSHFARRPDGLRDEVLRQLPDVLERLPVVH